MEDTDKIRWLKRVLVIKVIITFLAWGLPALLGPLKLLEWFNIAVPEDPLFVRFFGALATALGVAYWFAYRDPMRNVAILKVGVIDNGLVTLIIVILGLTAGISSWFIWLSGILTAFFCVSFVVLMPREQPSLG